MAMINTRIADYFLRTVSKYKTYTSIEQEKIKYTIVSLLSEGDKFIYLLALFGVIGYWKEFLICYFVMAGTRIFIGGFHLKTFTGCLIFSAVLFMVIIQAAYFINLSITVQLALDMFILIAIAYTAPIHSKNRPAYSLKRQRMFKKSAILSTTCVLVIGCLCNNDIYGMCIVFIMLFQAIQVLCMTGIIYYKNNVRKIFSER